MASVVVPGGRWTVGIIGRDSVRCYRVRDGVELWGFLVRGRIDWVGEEIPPAYVRRFAERRFVGDRAGA